MRTPDLLALALLAACSGSSNSGGTAPVVLGPPKLGIISGDNQVVAAGSPQLTNPVVGRLVRTTDGSLSFQWAPVLKKIGDAIVTPAYAQGTGTIVTGSPVAGAVVCATSVDSVHKLTPFVPCTNTDANGQATFFFTPGTKAGVALAEIRGTLDGQPAVFDTARATVMADPASPNARLHFDAIGAQGYAHTSAGNTSYFLFIQHSGATINLQAAVDSVNDKYGNSLGSNLTLGWTLVQLTNETLTQLDNSSNPQIGPYPSTLPASTFPVMAHNDNTVVGLVPGYEALTFYVNGHAQGTLLLAVLP